MKVRHAESANLSVAPGFDTYDALWVETGDESRDEFGEARGVTGCPSHVRVPLDDPRFPRVL
jgi:hypothetical protein